MTKSRSKLVGVHPCGDRDQVVTVVTPSAQAHSFRREPCAECPWRVDRPTRAFSVEAFRHSAATAYDLAGRTFACHMAGKEKPQTCAGFLLSTGAVHNLSLRLAAMSGRFSFDQVRSDVALYPNYRSMAIANGVSPRDPCLRGCR
jgi:hypothetical protein